MPTLTLAIPVDLKKRMDAVPEMNWSAVARHAFIKKLAELEFLETVSQKINLTEADAVRMGRELKRQMAKRSLAVPALRRS